MYGHGFFFWVVLMADPNWKNGFYYDSSPPHTGMKLARRMSSSSPFISQLNLNT
jgi:homoserine acetyltransferase